VIPCILGHLRFKKNKNTLNLLFYNPQATLLFSRNAEMIFIAYRLPKTENAFVAEKTKIIFIAYHLSKTKSVFHAETLILSNKNNFYCLSPP
jgi:hypothetical protein